MNYFFFAQVRPDGSSIVDEILSEYNFQVVICSAYGSTRVQLWFNLFSGLAKIVVGQQHRSFKIFPIYKMPEAISQNNTDFAT
jgi:ribosomal protein L21E